MTDGFYIIIYHYVSDLVLVNFDYSAFNNTLHFGGHKVINYF